MMSVSQIPHMLDHADLILTRNKDMLDVFWGHPRQRILNWITLSQNTFLTLAKGCDSCEKERNIHYNYLIIMLNFPDNYNIFKVYLLVCENYFKWILMLF